jgi:hypothetical protein
MTRTEIEAMIEDQFSSRSDKTTTMGFSITNALQEIGQRHDFQGLKEVETDISLLSLEVDFSSGAWTVATKTLTKVGEFASYTFASGDMIRVTAGTDTTVGWYAIASKTDNDSIVLVKSISTSDQTDISCTWIGTPQYVVLPSGVNKLHGAVLMDGQSSYEIDIRPKGYVDQLYPNPEYGLSTQPVLGYVMGGKLHLAPYTNTDYDIRLTTTSHPTLAAAGGSEPTLLGVENTLIARVLMDLYAGEEFPQTALYWEKQYEKSLNWLIKNDKRKPGTVFKASGTGSQPGNVIPPNAVSDISNITFGGV